MVEATRKSADRLPKSCPGRGRRVITGRPSNRLPMYLRWRPRPEDAQRLEHDPLSRPDVGPGDLDDLVDHRAGVLAPVTPFDLHPRLAAMLLVGNSRKISSSRLAILALCHPRSIRLVEVG